MAGLLNVADVSIHYRQRTCHNIGPARERAFISVCENKGIKNNIYTIAVSKSTLVIGLMLINNGFREHNMATRYAGEVSASLPGGKCTLQVSLPSCPMSMKLPCMNCLMSVMTAIITLLSPDVRKCHIVTT